MSGNEAAVHKNSMSRRSFLKTTGAGMAGRMPGSVARRGYAAGGRLPQRLIYVALDGL